MIVPSLLLRQNPVTETHACEQFQLLWIQGPLGADAGKRDWDKLTAECDPQLLEGLASLGPRWKHVYLLQHLMSYLKTHLSGEDNAYLWYVGAAGPHRGPPARATAADRATDVASHRLKHHLNRYPVPDWVHQQVNLNPYPKELMLRNHV